MRKNKGKILWIFLIVLSLISIQINAYAHSGKTDSSGGHKDNKNESGLGSYHYHCGGNPAHLHANGICPYSSSKSSISNSSSSKITTTAVPTTIDVTEIQINERIDSIEVGENKKLTATITPDNATDKNITWKSSNESIATISSSGEVTAKKPGTINITASTVNGKNSTIKIYVKEEQKIENSLVTSKNNMTNNSTPNDTRTDNQEDSNLLGGVLTLGVLGGGGYWGYKKYKKSK